MGLRAESADLLLHLDQHPQRAAAARETERQKHRCSAPSPSRRIPKPARKVTLSQLSNLNLVASGYCNGVSCANLLNNLTIPASTSLNFESHSDCKREHLDFIMNPIASKVSGRDALGGRVRPTLVVEFDTIWKSWVILIRTFGEGLSLKSTIRDNQEVSSFEAARPLHTIALPVVSFEGSDNPVQAFASLYPLSQVRVISTRRAHFRTWRIWQALSSLPNIQEIAVSCKEGVMPAFFRFMRENPAAFPKLEWLVFGGPVRDKHDPDGQADYQRSPWSAVAPLVPLLRNRKKQGLGVKRLDLDFHVKVADIGEFERDIPELKALVEVLECWEDKSQDT